MNAYKRSIAIAPEGTRTVHGQLGDFKKGAFHLALEAKAPITPIISYGAYHMWNPVRGFLLCFVCKWYSGLPKANNDKNTIRFVPCHPEPESSL
jgi:1-acyl-sn-glycerol-3-phosphate acyltransferase